MPEIDIAHWFDIMVKGGPAAFVLALGYTLIGLVREVRGGKLGAQEKDGLTAQVAKMQAQLDLLQGKVDRLEAELEHSERINRELYRQRDQARTRVEYLEMLHNIDPRTGWPPDPDSPATPSSAPTATTLPPLPPLPPEQG